MGVLQGLKSSSTKKSPQAAPKPSAKVSISSKQILGASLVAIGVSLIGVAILTW